MKIFKGFTLAEVLITLGIIGVVAALTIPSLIRNIQDRHFKAVWKKTFASVANAYRLGMNDEDLLVPHLDFDYGAYNQGYQDVEVYYKIFTNLKTLDYCVTGVNLNENCSNSWIFTSRTGYKNNCQCKSINSDKDYGCAYNNTLGFAVLPDGVHLFAHAAFWSHPDIMVDVNGPSGPNVVGRDIFIILIRNDKVIAGGAPGYELKGCDKSVSSNSGFVDAESYSGSGCGYKYLMEK